MYKWMFQVYIFIVYVCMYVCMYVCINIYTWRISVLEFEFRGFTEIYANVLSLVAVLSFGRGDYSETESRERGVWKIGLTARLNEKYHKRRLVRHARARAHTHTYTHTHTHTRIHTYTHDANTYTRAQFTNFDASLCTAPIVPWVAASVTGCERQKTKVT